MSPHAPRKMAGQVTDRNHAAITASVRLAVTAMRISGLSHEPAAMMIDNAEPNSTMTITGHVSPGDPDAQRLDRSRDGPATASPSQVLFR